LSGNKKFIFFTFFTIRNKNFIIFAERSGIKIAIFYKAGTEKYFFVNFYDFFFKKASTLKKKLLSLQPLRREGRCFML